MKQGKRPSKPTTSKVTTQSLLNKIEQFCFNKQKIILIASCLLSLLFSLLLFNPDVSVGGDDSAYIMDSYKLLNGIAFPMWQGPLYPIALLPFIAIFGVNLVVLKLISVICWVAAVYFTYKLLVKIANYTIASIVSLISSVSLMLSIYASTTYSEPFFMLLQVLFLVTLIKVAFDVNSQEQTSGVGIGKVFTKKIILQTIALAALTYALYQTRSVAIVAIPISIAVLLLEKKYIPTALYFGWTAIIHVLSSVYRSVVWGVTSVSFGGQLNNAFLKNFYKASEGKEDLMGLVQRFWDNSNLYLSKHLAKLTGLAPYDLSQINPTLTLLLYFLVIAAFVILWKNHRKICYSFAYLAAMIGATFILLQKTWDQERLIMIYFPLVLAFVLYAIHVVLDRPAASKLQWIGVGFALILFFACGKQTLHYFGRDYKIEHRFDSGRYESYTQDWQNYMLASKWAGENLPDSSVVICRKISMSWIASGGKEIFKGINRVPTTNADTLIMNLKKLGATHVIMGNLRILPKKKTNRTINTVRNTLFYITTKLPGAFKLVKSFGNDEEAYIFEVDFSENMDRETMINNLDAALIINPKNLNICLTKADYYYQKNEYEKGLWYINFGITQYPKDANLHFAQGIGYFQMKKWEKASTGFNNSIKLDAQKPNTWYYYALSLYNLGKTTEAKQALAEAKKLGQRGTAEFERELNRH